MYYREGTVVQTVECPVKVCANPSRDAPKEDERKRKEEEKSGRGRGTIYFKIMSDYVDLLSEI